MYLRSAQLAVGVDQVFGRYVQRIGSAQQIRFVRRQEFQHCCQNSAIGQPFPQDIGCQTGQRKQPPRPVVIGQ